MPKSICFRVADLLEEYFDNKIKHFNFYNDGCTEQRVNKKIRDTIEDVIEMVGDCDSSVDLILEDFDSTSALKDYIRTTKIDEKWQEEKEKSLWA